ncbi:MAG: PucR family transcriptional regulator [Solirubrobacterales bacterium]
MAASTAAAVIAEVPGFSSLRGPAGATLDEAVEVALRGFLSLASRSADSDAASPHQPMLDAAYTLGRGEVRSGRTMDVLLAAYRVGARVAWREWSRVAIAAQLPPEWLVQFAELNFAYIDELSAASVSGYADELATRDRVVQRNLDRLTRRLLAGGPADALEVDAERAGWRPPAALSAVLLPGDRARGIRTLVDARSLQLTEELPRVEDDEEIELLLVPTIGAEERARLRRALRGRGAILGPERPWIDAGLSYSRALQVRRLGLEPSSGDAIDADDHLVDLVIASDAEALADLRSQVLAPLASLRPTSAEKLADTLRAWLLHQGRREDIAAALFIHPQTVRYRMGQLRELYGKELDDPETVLAATIALGTAVKAPADER